MVRRRSVALPSLFPWPRSRHRDLTGWPLSSPVLPSSDHSASPYLSRLGWSLRFRCGIKREALPRCRHCRVSPAFELDFAATLVFPSGWFLAKPSLAHLCRCSAHSPSKLFRHLHRQPLEAARKKTERRTPAFITDHGSVPGDVRVPPLDACSDVPLHRRRNLSSFSFPCTHPSPASSWTALRQWGERHVSFALSEFSLPRSVREYIIHLCNLCLIGRSCSNLVVESRDEIQFKGGRLWRPRFSAGFINPNDPVNWVDSGQTTVNLGHHLEKHHRQPLMTPLVNLGQPLVKTLLKTPWTPFDHLMSSETFAVFSKFHLNTSKSSNVKVVYFVEGHNFHVEWHLSFEA
jgi:hypothetical protein